LHHWNKTLTSDGYINMIFLWYEIIILHL
jgi:hypothetical protein